MTALQLIMQAHGINIHRIINVRSFRKAFSPGVPISKYGLYVSAKLDVYDQPVHTAIFLKPARRNQKARPTSPGGPLPRLRPGSLRK